MMSDFLKKIIDVVASLLPVSQHIVEQRVVAGAINVQGSVIYQLPKNMANLPASLQYAFTNLLTEQLSLPERYVVRFKEVNVASYGVVFRNLSIYIPSLVHDSLINSYKGRLLFKQWSDRTACGRQDADLGLVFNHWSTINYFHWVVESLPRLLILQQVRPDCVLLLPAGAPQYIHDTVALFGFKRPLELVVGQVVEARSLWFVEHMGNFWLQDAALLAQLQTRVRTFFNLEACQPNRRVYVSRNRASYRRIANEQDVLTVVQAAGFEVYYFEEMTFAQQVKLLHETHVLLAQHGASLTNLLWMQTSTAVIELLNEASPNLTYFKLANQCAIDYYCLACTSTSETATNDSDIIVDTEGLATTVRQVLM